MTVRPSNETDSTSTTSVAGAGWLLRCPPGLAPVLEKEMVYVGAMKRGQKLFVSRQRNHDLVFAGRLNDDGRPSKLRIAEMALRCPIYGRFKVSKRQLGILAAELKAIGPRRLVVSVAGRVFQRQDLARWLTSEMGARGYVFDPEIEDEVWMFCIDESWYMGFPAFKSREAAGRDARVEERQGSLPPSIAAAVAFAGMPKADDIVLDPTCGSGTLLSECHAYAPGALLIGCDVDAEAAAIASRNLNGIPGARVLCTDSRSLSLPEANVTLVLANLPFGRQFGDKKSNARLYSDLLASALRLRDPARSWRAVLFTSDVESMQTAFAERKELRAKQLFKASVRGELACAWLAQA